MSNTTDKDKAELASLRAQLHADPNPMNATQKSAAEDRIAVLKAKIADAEA